MALTLRAALVSLLLLAAFLLAWHVGTRGSGPVAQMDPEYAKLMGATATEGKSAMPGPLDVGAKLWEHLKQPFYDNGPNDKGVGIQLAYSIARVGVGYMLAVVVAVPIGFLIGMSPLMNRALDPFIQVLKPISPLAWMPLALFTLKDSDVSAVFVIFICSIWPMLINTAFGVASVRRDWLNVAKTLEVNPLRKAFAVILPAAAPTILTGMRMGFTVALLSIIGSETIASLAGLGHRIVHLAEAMEMTQMFAYIAFVVMIAAILNALVSTLEARGRRP